MKSKLIVLIATLILLFIIYVIFSFAPKNYETTYKLNNFTITEKFDKKNKIYSFIFQSKKNYNYEIELQHKYIRKRKLVTKIANKNNCISLNFKKIEDQSICKEDNNYYTTYYNQEYEFNIKDTYENVNIYNLNNKTFLVWNYTDFIYLKNNDYKKIELFKEDHYNLDIITQYKKYLVVADYNNKYTFNKFYIINSKNGKVSSSILNKDIYFDSYILGTRKKYIYLYDLKEQQEYMINPLKEYIYKTDKGIYQNNEFIKLSDNKLSKKDYYFNDTTNFYYEIEDNRLIYKTPNTKVYVTNLDTQNILYQNDNECYFISDNKMYYVNYLTGIKPIMEYSEWEFNNKNIYIF